MNVREATIEDAASIADIYNQAMADPEYISTGDQVPVTAENRRQWLANPQLAAFVLEARDRQIAGWSVIAPFSFRPQFDNTAQSAVFMERQFRSGLGGAVLFLQTIRAAARLGYRRLINLVFASNTPSVRATQRVFNGPPVTIRNATFVRGKWEDVVLFTKDLNAPEDPSVERFIQRYLSREQHASTGG